MRVVCSRVLQSVLPLLQLVAAGPYGSEDRGHITHDVLFAAPAKPDES
jgi:hypothetical protein